MVDTSRIKQHTRVTKSGTKTVKSYDRKKRLKRVLAGIGVTGLAGLGLYKNRNRLKNILNTAKNKLAKTEETKLLVGSNLKVLPATKDSTQKIKNEVLGKMESKKERLARLFPTKKEQVTKYVSDRKRDKNYIKKARKKLELADIIQDKATDRDGLRRAFTKRNEATQQISRSTKRLQEMEKSSPLAKAFQKTNSKLTRTENTKVKAKGKRPEKKN